MPRSIPRVLAASLVASCAAPPPPSPGPTQIVVTSEPPPTAPSAAPQATAPQATASPSASHTAPLATKVNADGDRIPAGWEPQQMATALYPEDRPPGTQMTAQILAWRVNVDERPLYVESAILWIQLRRAGAPDRWILLRVYRHPRETSGRGSSWDQSVIYDAPQTPLKRYDAPPKNKDVEQFLHESFWTDGVPGFQELGADVCRNGWKRVIGEPALNTR